MACDIYASVFTGVRKGTNIALPSDMPVDINLAMMMMMFASLRVNKLKRESAEFYVDLNTLKT